MQRRPNTRRLRLAKSAGTVLALLLLAACLGVPRSSDSPSNPVGSVPSSSGLPPESATDLLECDGPVSDIGGRADDFGPDRGGATADEAFDTWIASNPFTVPRSGYRGLGSIGDRSVYVYEADGRVKVVVVISPRFGELVGARFAIEELRTCDPSEYGAAVDLGPSTRVWTHAESGEIISDIAGPGHCGWESARLLHINDDDGTLEKQYVRDPLGVLMDIPSLLDTYAEGVELPDDATFSGYRSEDTRELWFTPEDRAAYVVTPDGIERWPRAEPPIGCA